MNLGNATGLLFWLFVEILIILLRRYVIDDGINFKNQYVCTW